MAGRLVSSDENHVGKSPRLTTSIEPSGAMRGTAGDVAFKDAVGLVALSWFLLIFLMWSLRHHIV